MFSSYMSSEEIKRIETEENERTQLEIHPNFRLFLSAQEGYSEEYLDVLGEDEEAPQPMLRDSVLIQTVKLTVENPIGLKASLQRATAQLRRCVTEPFSRKELLGQFESSRLTSRSPSMGSA